MGESIKLQTAPLQVIRTVNERLMSYNVEFTEVTGGTFWKAYTPEQIAGIEEVPPPDFTQGNPVLSMLEWIEPIDSKNPKLIKLAKAIAPGLWVRVSGGWATKTYYDFDGTGETPAGYQARLTKEQWINILDFVKAVDGKLLISLANCEGLHKHDEPWNPSQAEKIFALSKEHGVPI